MSTIIENVLESYQHLNDLGDPKTKHLPMVSSFLSFPILLSCYMYFVLKLGPDLMKNRPAFNIKEFVMAYNLLQILINILGLCLSLSYWPHTNMACMPLLQTRDFRSTYETAIHYFYYISKIIDFTDTVLFVLRKKQAQVSFLHLYHHISVAISAWITVKFFVGGQLYYSGILNYAGHIVLYSYYFETVRDPNSYIYKYKQNITMFQILLQSSMLLSTSVVIFSECTYPKDVAAILCVYIFSVILMFVDFYHHAYSHTKKIATE